MGSALPHFHQTAARSKKLLTLYKEVEKERLIRGVTEISADDTCDLLRAAVVFSVSAMDAYFTDKFADMVVPFLQKKAATDKLIEVLKGAGLDTRVALELISMERPWRRIRTLIEAYFGKYTTQRFQTIDDLFLGFGLKDFSDHVCSIANRKNLKTRISGLVSRRHSIVHEGDLNAHGHTRKIEHSQIKRQIEDLVIFVDAADKLANNTLKPADKPLKPMPTRTGVAYLDTLAKTRIEKLSSKI